MCVVEIVFQSMSLDFSITLSPVWEDHSLMENKPLIQQDINYNLVILKKKHFTDWLLRLFALRVQITPKIIHNKY